MRAMRLAGMRWGCILGAVAVLAAQDLPPLKLPAPRTAGGTPLLTALKERRTTREFSRRPLPPQVLSDLLWAGFGINRPETRGRTAPSAMNSQEIDIYVALAEGLFLYDPDGHRLDPVLAGDARPATGSQDFVKDAPVALIYVADLARLTKARPEERERYASVDTGYVSQNVYLFCAAEGLGTVVHELDRARLTPQLKLRPDQRVMLAQAVGYPRDLEPKGTP